MSNIDDFKDLGAEFVESLSKFRKARLKGQNKKEAFESLLNTSNFENDGEVMFYDLNCASKELKVGLVTGCGVPIRENLVDLYYDYKIDEGGYVALGRFKSSDKFPFGSDDEVYWYGLDIVLNDTIETIDLSDLKLDKDFKGDFIVRLFRCKNFKNVVYPNDKSISVKVINEKYLISYMIEYENYIEYDTCGYLVVPFGKKYKQQCIDRKDLNGYLLIDYDVRNNTVSRLGFTETDLTIGDNSLIGNLEYTVEDDDGYGKNNCNDSIELGAYVDTYSMLHDIFELGLDYEASLNILNNLIDKLIEQEDFVQAVIDFNNGKLDI